MLHVLLIEDDPAIAEMYRVQLESDGFRVTVATTGEIGYAIVDACRGRGYATAALGLLVEKAGQLGARALLAETEADNPASQRVLERHVLSRSGVRARTLRYRRELSSS